jgi:hypothetical protein
MAVIMSLDKIHLLKNVGIPEYYLGGNVEFLNFLDVPYDWSRGFAFRFVVQMLLGRNCQIKNFKAHLVLLGLWLLTPLQYGNCCEGFLICYLILGTLGLNSIMKSYLIENQCTSFHQNNMVAITSMTWEVDSSKTK